MMEEDDVATVVEALRDTYQATIMIGPYIIPCVVIAAIPDVWVENRPTAIEFTLRTSGAPKQSEERKP